MIIYNYEQYSEILKNVDNTILIPDNILSETPILSYDHWQKVNKVKPDYIKQISMCLNQLTEKNIDTQVNEIKPILKTEDSKNLLVDKVIENIIINNYYCKLYINFINKLGIKIQKKKILDNINAIEKKLSNEDLIQKDKLIGLIKFICIQVNNKLYTLELINNLLDKYFDILDSDSTKNTDIIYIYADIIKSIVINCDCEINKKYIEKALRISKNNEYKTRLRFIFLDVCDIYRKKFE
tara:strand:- start:1477 stop:2193 length:717 start_codon:yes stop_codon:yes gene_type:complete